MNTKRIQIVMIVALGILICTQSTTAWAQSDSKKARGEGEAKAKVQTVCPISGEAIEKDSPYVDAKGKRIYACCQSCVKKIKADPTAAIKSLRAKGQKAENHWALCAKCGQIKGTKACCDEAAAKCDMCKLAKGSPACCKHLKLDGDKEVLLCTKCGQVKGTEACCAKDAQKCAACGLAKGSPACCKLGKKAEGSDSKGKEGRARGKEKQDRAKGDDGSGKKKTRSGSGSK